MIDFDDERMVLLPSGCWVIAPRVLTKKDGTPVGRLSLIDALSPATWATGDSGPSEDDALDAGSPSPLVG